ncbi:MAG: RNA methyltransferase [Bacteroidales bacterium]|nr:RNA methyltransferase [Bacteroidales bacterium]
MLTNNEFKILRQLKQKKYRQEQALFLVEGKKMVEEVLKSSFVVKNVFATESFIEKSDAFDNVITTITKTQSEQLSSLVTDPEVYALVEMKKDNYDDSVLKDRVLILDDVSDAGNLGTIIRTADWFNIDLIVCSEDCVELYNSKVLQASMGSFTRVDVIYRNLADFIPKHNYIYYGAFLDGQAVNDVYFSSSPTALVLGSESHGISETVAQLISNRINIPLINTNRVVPESLNVATATAILCYAWTK